MKKSSTLAIHNIRLFIAFRIFFNSRFYYPVFSIFFLDFGLTLSQFAILNAVWASTIVLCEVPSGALADTVGRKNLLVFTGILMVFEMGLLAFAPRENPTVLFLFFLANRILSGIAEASASGADEALAYDTLVTHGRAHEWGIVLENQIRFQSLAFIFAMIIGGLVYDPVWMGKLADWLGIPVKVTKDITLRFPVYLTLVSAILTLIVASMMKEIHVGDDQCEDGKKCTKAIADTVRLTLKTGRWIINTPFVLFIILIGMLFDSVIRMVITMSSQYYRMIDIPEAMFGVIGSAMAGIGLVVPTAARHLAHRYSYIFNLLLVASLTLTGLIGMCFFLPVFGFLPALLLFSNMYFLGFFVSHYLNHATRSDQRATVLSFKGLSFNLAYGAIGLLYSLLLAFLRSRLGETHPDLEGEALKNAVFMESMTWFPWYLGIFLAVIFVFAFRKLQVKNPGR